MIFKNCVINLSHRFITPQAQLGMFQKNLEQIWHFWVICPIGSVGRSFDIVQLHCCSLFQRDNNRGAGEGQTWVVCLHLLRNRHFGNLSTFAEEEKHGAIHPFWAADREILGGIDKSWVVHPHFWRSKILGGSPMFLDEQDSGAISISTKLCPPVSNRDIDQSVLLLNGKYPLLDTPQSGARTWQLATPGKLGSTSSPAAPRFPPGFTPK